MLRLSFILILAIGSLTSFAQTKKVEATVKSELSDLAREEDLGDSEDLSAISSSPTPEVVMQMTVKQPKISFNPKPRKMGKIVFNNNAKMLILPAGKTLNDVAENYGISIEKLEEYNDLPQGVRSLPYNFVYLEPKQGVFKGDMPIHFVSKGETLHSIAQFHGIKMKELAVLNELPKGITLAEGTVIQLQENVNTNLLNARVSLSKPVQMSTSTPSALLDREDASPIELSPLAFGTDLKN